MDRIALLANPESGSGRAGEVESELRSLGASVARFPIEEAERALEAVPQRIVVAGGDGSIGPAAVLAARAAVPLAVVPAGTANDFARAFALPGDLREAVRLATRGTRRRRLDLARMSAGGGEGERPFVNVASVGLPPAAARRASALKRALGPLAYVVGAVGAVSSARPVRCRITDSAENELYRGEVWQATVACSGRFGAGSRVEADPTDGLLDAVAVEAGSRLALALRGRGLRAGTLEDQRGVHRRRSRAFAMEVEDGTPFNVDGELCTRSGRVRFTVEPDAFELIVG